MTAYEESMAELLRRVEALEAWNREGGLLYNIGTKLENVADQLEEDRTTIYGQLTEIEEAISQDRLYAVNREREEHKARWHATYNAAITRLASFTHGSAASELEIQAVHNTVHRACVLYADRAHGPLGSKTRADDINDHADSVNALVNAVLEACDYDLPDQVMALLTRAVEPFEAQK
jgi:hypothetical protein